MPSHVPPRRLVDRLPAPDPRRLLADLVPPRRFSAVTLDGYRPDAAHPSQAAALAVMRDLVDGLRLRPAGRRLLRGAPAPTGRGSYLDGGFGVGKTHLLAAAWSAAGVPKAYGTFVEYTQLVGALGFAATVAALSSLRLVCIDEFELDDPGDTVLMARLLREVTGAGATVAATSNTLPDALGEGRFAAEDFLREIQSVAESFAVVRIDGPDFRHRGAPPRAAVADAGRWAAVADTSGATVDEFGALCAHLARLHPSRYGALLDGVSGVCLQGVQPLTDQNVALRLVVLADRLYDRGLPVAATGTPLDEVFGDEMLRGGYRKKYLRAVSRLAALTREA